MTYLQLLDRLEWDKVNEILIDKFCWDYDFKPLSKAKLCLVKNQGLCVKMWSYENNPVSIHLENNSSVCQDSCLEFFLNAFPIESDIYMNFEVNHLGTMLLMYGTGRKDRKPVSTLNLLNPKVTTFEGSDDLGDFWGIEYIIPLEFLNTIYSKSDILPGEIVKAGLYKCGDKTGRPHYGSWQVIETENPDFHRPEFFGKLTVKE